MKTKIMRRLPWLDGEAPRDLARWALAGATVVAVYATLISGYMLWHHPEPGIGDDSPVVTVELAPADNVVDAQKRDIAPGPEDMVEQKPTPEAEKEPTPVPAQPPPPDASTPDVALPKPKPPKKVEEPRPAAPRTTARVQSGAPRADPSWAAFVVRHIQHFKRYPAAAQALGEQGVVLLRFSVDRRGHVLASSIVRSSGHADLDREVMTMIERADPLPAFPADMTQAQLDLTIPIRFSLR